MNWLLALLVLFFVIIGGFIGYGLFGIGLFGIITQFLIAGLLTLLWDKLHPKYVCKVCGFKTVTKERMREHVGKHLKQKHTKNFGLSKLL